MKLETNTEKEKENICEDTKGHATEKQKQRLCDKIKAEI